MEKEHYCWILQQLTPGLIPPLARIGLNLHIMQIDAITIHTLHLALTCNGFDILLSYLSYASLSMLLYNHLDDDHVIFQ